MGFLQLATRSQQPEKSLLKASTRSISRISAISAPAQNVEPPVSTMTLILGSACNRSNCDVMDAMSARDSALRASGRPSVITPTLLEIAISIIVSSNAASLARDNCVDGFSSVRVKDNSTTTACVFALVLQTICIGGRE